MRPEGRVGVIQQIYRTLAPRGRVVVIERGPKRRSGRAAEAVGFPTYRSAVPGVGRRDRRPASRRLPRRAPARRARRPVLLRRRTLAGTLPQPTRNFPSNSRHKYRQGNCLVTGRTYPKMAHDTEELTSGRLLNRRDRKGRCRTDVACRGACRSRRVAAGCGDVCFFCSVGRLRCRANAARRWRAQRGVAVRQARVSHTLLPSCRLPPQARFMRVWRPRSFSSPPSACLKRQKIAWCDSSPFRRGSSSWHRPDLAAVEAAAVSVRKRRLRALSAKARRRSTVRYRSARRRSRLRRRRSPSHRHLRPS